MIRIQFRTEQKELNPLPLGAIDDLGVPLSARPLV